MKTLLIILTIAFAFASARAQVYYSSSTENILSFSNTTGISEYLTDGATIALSEKLRFTMFFNLEENINYDFNKYFGFYSGLGFRNIGFLLRNEDIKYVFRSLNFGIPLAIKIGNLAKKQYLILGTEAEYSIHLKEKTVHDGARRKTGEYFSDKINTFMPSVFFGISKNDFFMKVKFYLNDFINRTYKVDGTMPFLDVDSRIFYFSFGHNFKN